MFGARGIGISVMAGHGIDIYKYLALKYKDGKIINYINIDIERIA